MLKAHQVERFYGELPILKGINLEVAQGEVVAIVGASGAGKSTLLHILGTLDRPDKGQVWINDTDLLGLKEKELANFRNQEIGFVFQFHNLMPEFTALENVCMPAFLQAKCDEKKVRKRGEELLELLNLQHRLTHLPSQMSGGEQQRVAVARALINSPSIIFADEPSGNLDSQNAEELHQLFFKLRNDFNQTFVIVTHNEHLANLSDRKLEIKDGRMI